MDKKTVFVKTNIGESEFNDQSDTLYGDAKRILHLVDDESTVAEITRRAPPSLRASLQEVLQELVEGGYIRDMRAPVSAAIKPVLKMSSPSLKMATPKIPEPATREAAKPIPSMPDMQIPASANKQAEPVINDKKAELDFSFLVPDNSQNEIASKAIKEKAEQSASLEAAAKAAKLKAYEKAKEKAKIEVAARGKLEAEARAKLEAVAKARGEAEARAKIEAEAKLQKEAEAARLLKAEQELVKARAESEAVKARVEAEVRERIEHEAKAKQEAEAARLKIEKEAEKLRLELEAAKARAETEVRSRLDAEARAKAEADARVMREAEAERLRIEKVRAELEVARIKAESELKIRSEAEARIRAEVDARLKAEAPAKNGDRRSSNQTLASTGGNQIVSRDDQIEQAEKLRQSFVESFGKSKEKLKNDAFDFKLDTFSLLNSAPLKNIGTQKQVSETPASEASQIKTAINNKVEEEADIQKKQAAQKFARLKAEQEEAARLQAEQNSARIKAEQESMRLKAEQEAYRIKVQQEEERAIAEAEIQKLSDQQVRQWDEAKRRAEMQAQAEKDNQAKQAAESPQIKQQHRKRTPRKAFPLGKVLASLLLLALIAVAGLPYIWPLDEYIAPLEKEISAQLKQPVHITKINFSLLPLPKLELHHFEMGGGKELKAQSVVFNFDISALFATTKTINSVTLNHVKVSGGALDKVLGWLNAAGGSDQYPLARMALQHVEVQSEAIKLPLMNGSADFDAQGKFSHAYLKSEDAKLGLELQSLQNHLQLELNIHEGSLPVFSHVIFNELSASGLVENGEFIFTDFFAHVHGGTLTGKGLINWTNGWRLQGQLNAKSLELQNIFPEFGIKGQLYGDVNISMFGSALSQLDREPHMEGTFDARNAVLNKLDIDTVARFGSRPGVSGHSDFSELIGTMKLDRQMQHFNLSKIVTGGASGSGFFDVDEKQQLSGKLLVEVKGHETVNVSLKISGTPQEPILNQGR